MIAEGPRRTADSITGADVLRIGGIGIHRLPDIDRAPWPPQAMFGSDADELIMVAGGRLLPGNAWNLAAITFCSVSISSQLKRRASFASSMPDWATTRYGLIVRPGTSATAIFCRSLRSSGSIPAGSTLSSIPICTPITSAGIRRFARDRGGRRFRTHAISYRVSSSCIGRLNMTPIHPRTILHGAFADSVSADRGLRPNAHCRAAVRSGAWTSARKPLPVTHRGWRRSG